MKPTYCYWTVVDGEYTTMAQAVLNSARKVGVANDFHVWADRPVKGAISHQAGEFEKWKWGCLFKLTFLRDAVQKLDYDYFVWFDADNYFVRDPGDVLRVMHGSPLHIALECDVCLPGNIRHDWWDCPNATFAELMRAKGVKSQSIFNVNGGFFIVHRDAIDQVVKMAFDFSDYCEKRGFAFTDEPLLAYAMQMLCGDPALHTVRATADLWATDWTGYWRDLLPDGEPWWFIDYFTGEQLVLNPAIVHAMRSKSALMAASAGCPA